MKSATQTLSDIAARLGWAHLPGNVRGALWVLLAGFGFTGMLVCIKLVGKQLPVWQIITLRAGFALLVISPAIVRAGPRYFKTLRPGAHILRSLIGLCGVATMVLAVANLELALSTTLGFTRALFMILLALLFLGETIRWRRTTATCAGFLGVVICINPGADVFDPWTVVALISALFAAGVTTMVKRLTSTEPPLRILTWAYLIMGGVALVPAIIQWQPLSLTQFLLIALMGVFSAWGQSCVTYGLRAGEATAVMPFEYTRLLYAAGAGFLVFGEVAAPTTWLGGAVIIAANIYIAVREARVGVKS